MKIALCLLLSLAVGSGLYTAAAIGWSLLDPQGTGRTLLFTIPIGIGVTAGLGLLAAAVMMMPPGPPAKTRRAPEETAWHAAQPRSDAAESDEADLALWA